MCCERTYASHCPKLLECTTMEPGGFVNCLAYGRPLVVDCPAMRERRLWLIGAAMTLCVACTIDAQAPSDAAPTAVARWNGDEVEFTWTWDAEVDAFNVFVTRNGGRGAQVELPGQTRSFGANAAGSKTVELSLQACNKGLFKSTCTPWAVVVARR
jgi:hypothetical protein